MTRHPLRCTAGDDILALEPEAVALADSEGPDAALGWLQTRRV
jgi:type VI secretion system protein VasJ